MTAKKVLDLLLELGFIHVPARFPEPTVYRAPFDLSIRVLAMEGREFPGVREVAVGFLQKGSKTDLDWLYFQECATEEEVRLAIMKAVLRYMPQDTP